MGKHDMDGLVPSSTPPMPQMAAEAEEEHRRVLRKHKIFATGLLVFAAFVYIVCGFLDKRGAGSWVGFVRAAAEAGMVGGLADWFAVTALFRYPMGIKIPHTAIIRRKKDQLGQSLSSFVGDNFLNAQLITEKVEQAHLPLRLGTFLSQPENAEKVSSEVGKLLGNVVREINPDDAEAVINSALIDKLAEPAWGPPLGRVLEQLISEGKAEPIIQELANWLHVKAVDSEALIARLLDERRPIWAPRFINDIVGEKVYKEVVEWTSKVATEPDHEARKSAANFIAKLSSDLQNDESLIERVEQIKGDIMGSEAVANIGPTVWASASTSLIDAAQQPDSLLRRKVTELCLSWGEKLCTDEQLRSSVGTRISGIASFLADNYAPEVTAIISETIERWDADEASDKIELLVGKDLQYIRLNGTIVGALAGLAIYTVSTLVFGI